jgi:hypothetical protein
MDTRVQMIENIGEGVPVGAGLALALVPVDMAPSLGRDRYDWATRAGASPAPTGNDHFIRVEIFIRDEP